MRRRPYLACLLILAALLAALLLPSLAMAGPAPEATSPVITPEQGFFLSPKLRRLVKSHTSYEFGNPDQPRYNPLSRLEFPLDSWWGGLEVGYGHPRYSWRLELMTNISRDIDSGAKFKDSDWERPASPGVLTTYSEGQLRLKPSLTLDGSVDYSLRQHMQLPKGLDLRPVVGLRYQRYTFETYDGVQISRPEGQDNWKLDGVMGGEYIWFRQEYLQPYLGLRLAYGFELPKALAKGRQAEVSLQGDWAYVVGDNRDHHLLRGDRITQEHTTGDAWHFSLGLKLPLGDLAFLGLSGDYLRIRTTGQHDWYPGDQEGGGHESWDNGVKAWSEQLSLTLFLEIPFSSFLR
ncbi:MAG: omptin family outer membrane protease [Desulfarculus sp.]|nr:omptin family outer membrane protease [Desulfarculus sp.]